MWRGWKQDIKLSRKKLYFGTALLSRDKQQPLYQYLYIVYTQVIEIVCPDMLQSLDPRH